MESKTTKETKETSGAVQNYNVQPVMLPILPTSGPYLADPSPIDAAYTPGNGQITTLLSFKIPGNLNPTQVSVKQYYSALEPSVLYFYVSYTSESTAALKEVQGKFKASALDAAGTPIDLGAILSVSTMLVNTVGPKSSRGVMCTVRTTES